VAYRYEIRAILRRFSAIRKGKFFGQEFELEEKLDQLKKATEKARVDAPLPPAWRIHHSKWLINLGLYIMAHI
jgi:hypothetical protein